METWSEQIREKMEVWGQKFQEQMKHNFELKHKEKLMQHDRQMREHERRMQQYEQQMELFAGAFMGTGGADGERLSREDLMQKNREIEQAADAQIKEVLRVDQQEGYDTWKTEQSSRWGRMGMGGFGGGRRSNDSTDSDR